MAWSAECERVSYGSGAGERPLHPDRPHLSVQPTKTMNADIRAARVRYLGQSELGDQPPERRE